MTETEALYLGVIVLGAMLLITLILRPNAGPKPTAGKVYIRPCYAPSEGEDRTHIWIAIESGKWIRLTNGQYNDALGRAEANAQDAPDRNPPTTEG